eukprot:Lankesteria_metandrocarpae@DN5484_c1_g1_i27.p1
MKHHLFVFGLLSIELVFQSCLCVTHNFQNGNVVEPDGNELPRNLRTLEIGDLFLFQPNAAPPTLSQTIQQDCERESAYLQRLDNQNVWGPVVSQPNQQDYQPAGQYQQRLDDQVWHGDAPYGDNYQQLDPINLLPDVTEQEPYTHNGPISAKSMDGIFNVQPSACSPSPRRSRSPSPRRSRSPIHDSSRCIGNKIQHTESDNSHSAVTIPQHVVSRTTQEYRPEPPPASQYCEQKKGHPCENAYELGMGKDVEMNVKVSGEKVERTPLSQPTKETLRNDKVNDVMNRMKRGHPCENAYELEQPNGCRRVSNILTAKLTLLNCKGIPILVCQKSYSTTSGVCQYKHRFTVERPHMAGKPKNFQNVMFGEANAKRLAYLAACYMTYPRKCVTVHGLQGGMCNTPQMFTVFRCPGINVFCCVTAA